MRSNSKHTPEEIENYILMYLNEGISFKELEEACQGQLKIVGFRQSKNVGFGQLNLLVTF